jgi:CRISPR-associated protein Csm2
MKKEKKFDKKVNKNNINNIITYIENGKNIKQMIEEAENVSKVNITNVSRSKIRNIFGTVKKMEMTEIGSNEKKNDQPVDNTMKRLDPRIYDELLLLKPKLAYTKSRFDKTGYENLEFIIGNAIDKVKIDDFITFKRFCQFFEDLMAYHHCYGEK